MNGLRCPNCDLVNLLTAETCHRCGRSLVDLPQTAQVSVPVEETFQARAFASGTPNDIPFDNELGRKTFFWYRVYCGVLLLLYLAVTGLGIIMFFIPPENSANPAENYIIGAVYAIMGAIFAIAFTVALLLPRKPYNWIVGIVMICFGLTSCCFLPATVPLLIYWIKPETKAYLGRK